MASLKKKQGDLYISLDNLYIRDRGKIISWLNEIKVYKSVDGKIPGLLNNSKIQIITVTEDGDYNLILQWIKDNRDKFTDYDFTGIPDSTFVSLDRSNIIRNYQLRSWIHKDNLKKRQLSKNPNAIEFLHLWTFKMPI